MLPDRLETERLVLRPFASADSPAVHDYWTSDPNWARFNHTVPTDSTETDAEEFLAKLTASNRETRPSWAITQNERVIGVVALTFEQDHRIAVIGYGIHGDLRGQGLSAEATKTVIDTAFRSYASLQKIRAHTDARNITSLRVLEKLGFQREGILRSNQYAKGELADEAIYGLLRDEWSSSI